MMHLGKAIKNGYQKMFDWQGRESRRSYALWVLYEFILGPVVIICLGILLSIYYITDDLLPEKQSINHDRIHLMAQSDQTINKVENPSSQLNRDLEDLKKNSEEKSDKNIKNTSDNLVKDEDLKKLIEDLKSTFESLNDLEPTEVDESPKKILDQDSVNEERKQVEKPKESSHLSDHDKQQMEHFIRIIVVIFLWYIVHFIPHLSYLVRRAHDLGESALTALSTFIPGWGTVLWVEIMIKPGVEETNHYGPSPVDKHFNNVQDQSMISKKRKIYFE